jgi:hypothetical protein
MLQERVSHFWERKPAIAGALFAAPIIVAHAALPESLAIAGAALLIVSVASVYLGFAFAESSPSRVAVEGIGVVLYGSAALIGLAGPVWVIPVALALHPVWDAMHHPRALGGAPTWFPTSCAVFDLLLASWIAWRLCA